MAKKKKESKPEHKLRILFSTNAMWCPSGYAQQARQILPLMRDEGYPVAASNFYGQQGGRFEYEGIMQYPGMADQWGADAMANHGVHFNADVTFSLQDIWTLDENMMKNVRRWIPIVPVDHEPVPPPIIDRARKAYRIVTYSKFGYRELKKQGVHSTYIPHTVDTEMFKKVDQSKARKALGIPEDVFIFGMIAANKDNPPRKSFQHVMDAYVMFKKQNPGVKSALYIHTILQMDKGFPIQAYAKYLGIEKELYTTELYDYMYNIPTEQMKNLYGIFDVLLSPSMSEGFGVPIIEAQSCEVPVITTDFTAQKDLVKDGETGFLVDIQWKRYTPLLAYSGFPDTADLFEAMNKVYKADRVKMGKAGRKMIQEEYDTNVVWKKHWKPFLQRVEDEIYEQ